ncbi:MAG TPA: T9SS type A sorting domain-containing protein, partial [Chitinophaga sp.]|nr:T9SS type A sorting domain-containing protein [Chitinophaga sp.]
YYVTATSANGCIKKDSVTVSQNIDVPNLSIATPAVLTCATTSVNLTASSTTAGTTFTWTGRTAGQNPISVTAPGKYYVTATTANGCSKQDSVTVSQNIDVPNLSIATPATLTCSTTSVNLTASSTTAGTTFTWTGKPAGQNPINVGAFGKYYVTATAPNGCIKKDSVTVMQNVESPADVSIESNGPLNCSRTSVTLKGKSTTSTVAYEWTYPDGTKANTAEIITDKKGTYQLKVTNTANGCSVNTSTTVLQDITAPGNVQITNDGPLTCTNTIVTLAGSSGTGNASYLWTGPDNFRENSATAFVEKPGIYTLLVTDPNNGCFVRTQTEVKKNVTPPEAVINVPSTIVEPFTADVITAQIVTNATYRWTLSSSDNSWMILDGEQSSTLMYQSGNPGGSGTIELTVIDRGNGCQSSAQVVLTTTSPTIGASMPAVQEQSAEMEYQAYPNPFTDRATITFKAPVSGKVTVELYGGMHGNMERILFNDNAFAGRQYKVTLNAVDLPAGMHICVIRANGKVYTRKMILVR